MIEIIKGNIFTTNRQVIVNTVNCVGIMGAGLALECRLRYPEMFIKYQELCDKKQIDIGKLWIYKTPQRWILNFPTKLHWKNPSKIDYLHAGLEKFMATYQERGIESIAFPLLGADRGGLDSEQSLNVMKEYLQYAEIPIEIYLYDPKAPDDLFQKVKNKLKNKTIEELVLLTGLRRNYIEKLCLAMESEDICQLNQLANVKGIGIKTVEKVFEISDSNLAHQANLL